MIKLSEAELRARDVVACKIWNPCDDQILTLGYTRIRIFEKSNAPFDRPRRLPSNLYISWLMILKKAFLGIFPRVATFRVKNFDT